MPSKKILPRPTEAELQILQVLWRRGASTVRDVHEELCKRERTGYTTALKLLQVMFGKGLVKRDDSQRAHVYMAAMSKDFTQRQFVKDMLSRVFEGSPSQLMLHALGDTSSASPEELARIRDLIERLEREQES